MALVRTALLGQITAGQFGTGNFTSTAFTPANSSLLVVAAAYVENSGSTTDPTSALTISGGSLTWTQQATAVAAPTAFPSLVKIWTAPVTTGASMSVTLSTSGRNAGLYAVSVVCYTGHNAGTPVGGTASGQQNGGFTGPPDPATITLGAAPASTDETFAIVFADKTTTNISPGSTWTEIDDLFNSNWGSAESEILTGSTGTSVSWVDLRPGGGSLFNYAAAAIVVKAAAGATQGVAPVVVAPAAPTPAGVAILGRGSLADAPVLTTARPIVVTAAVVAAAASSVLLRAPAPVAPSIPTQPYVVTSMAAASPLAAVLLRRPASGIAKVATLADDFTTQDNAKWTYFAAANVSAGQLQLVPTVGYDNKIDSLATYDLTSSTVSVQVVTAPLGNGGIDTFLKAYAGADEVRFYREGTLLHFEEVVGGSTSATTLTYDPVAHAWWRIRHDGTNLLWETASDGLNWTTQRTKVPARSWAAVTVQLLAGFFGTEPTPGTSVFDNLNVAPSGSLTGSQPLVVTAWSPPPARSAILSRGSLADPAVPTTGSPYVISRPSPGSVGAAMLLRGAPAALPGQQPTVVTFPAAVPPPTAVLLRGALADAPVLTTAAPLVVTAATPPSPAAAIQVRSPQPAAAAVSGPTTAPIVVTQPGPPPAAAAILLRSSLLDVPVATPGPLVVTSPAPIRLPQSIVVRGSLADAPVLTTTGPLVVTAPTPPPRPAVLLGRNPQPSVAPASGPGTAPIVVTAAAPVVTGRTALVRAVLTADTAPRTPTVTVDLARAVTTVDLSRTTATADLTRPSVTVAL